MNANSKKAPPPPAGIVPTLEALYVRRIALDQLIRALERYERVTESGEVTVLSFPSKLAC
jgi:hypothetical protein